MTALKEHVSYSGHYLWAGSTDVAREATEELEDDCKPLGKYSLLITCFVVYLVIKSDTININTSKRLKIYKITLL